MNDNLNEQTLASFDKASFMEMFAGAMPLMIEELRLGMVAGYRVLTWRLARRFQADARQALEAF